MTEYMKSHIALTSCQAELASTKAKHKKKTLAELASCQSELALSQAKGQSMQAELISCSYPSGIDFEEAYVCMYAYVCMHVCVYVCMYAYVYGKPMKTLLVQMPG